MESEFEYMDDPLKYSLSASIPPYLVKQTASRSRKPADVKLMIKIALLVLAASFLITFMDESLFREILLGFVFASVLVEFGPDLLHEIIYRKKAEKQSAIHPRRIILIRHAGSGFIREFFSFRFASLTLRIAR